MLLKHNYFFFKKAISPPVCKKILEAARKEDIEQATLRDRARDVAVRDCKVAWINKPWIYDIINPFIHAANKKAGWNFQWDWNECSQFTVYEKGHYYGWHVDQSADVIKSKGKNVNGKIRKLSLTLQLTDKTQYEGGNFQFKWITQSPTGPLDIVTVDDAKDIGTIIIFPSFIYHQVLPITKGKRESLVNWSLGKQFN